MPGVRIVHATDRSCTYTLVDATRPYVNPINCPVCGRVHVFKTYHLSLDGVGAVIVSPEVAERIKRLGPTSGFAITNEVKKPPKLLVGMSGRGNNHRPDRKLVINPHLREPN